MRKPLLTLLTTLLTLPLSLSAFVTNAYEEGGLRYCCEDHNDTGYVECIHKNEDTETCSHNSHISYFRQQCQDSKSKWKITRVKFTDCQGLVELRCPKFITGPYANGHYDEVGAFANCVNLELVEIPGWTTMVFVPKGLFANCAKLKKFEIPQQITRIEKAAFSGCQSLTEMTIPINVNTIEDRAFYGCTGINKLTINTAAASISKMEDWFDSRNAELYIYHEFKSKIPQDYPQDKIHYLDKVDLKNLSIQSTSIDFELEANDMQIDSILVDSIKIPLTENNKYHHTFVNPFETKTTVEIHYIDENGIRRTYVDENEKAGLATITQNSKIMGVELDAEIAKDSSTGAVQRIWIMINGVSYDLNGQNTIKVSNLEPGQVYEATLCATIDNVIYKSNAIEINTRDFSRSYTTKSTQTTIKFENFYIKGDETTGEIEEYGLMYNGIYYPAVDSCATVSGLIPSRDYEPDPWHRIQFYAKCGGQMYVSGKHTVKTAFCDMKFSEELEPGVTCCIMKYTEKLGDASRYMTSRKLNSIYDIEILSDTTAIITGLKPNSSYEMKEIVVTFDIEGVKSLISLHIRGKFNTMTPILTPETTNLVSNTSAVISASTNLQDFQDVTGFEWRRYDAPDLVPSNRVLSPVYKGKIMGKLSNLSPSTYYKFRPFVDIDGEIYYGEWIAFGTADAYVYFEPMVSTFAPARVTETTAMITGYALAGSDDIIEQGFEYQPVEVQSRAMSDGAVRVPATGERMVVTLTDLQPATTYSIRAYAVTARETTYGEEQTFTTAGILEEAPDVEEPGQDGIIEVSQTEATTFNVYNLSGMCVRRNATDMRGLRPGIYIVNGRKLLVK